jgi:hypothetical protein
MDEKLGLKKVPLQLYTKFVGVFCVLSTSGSSSKKGTMLLPFKLAKVITPTKSRKGFV